MDYKSLTHIWLNGKKFSKEEILTEKDDYPNHTGEVISFLKEWFSESEFLSVQTSGSTGVPKLITLPKQSFVESAINTCGFLSLNKETQALLCIPIKYIGGKMMAIRALVSGYNLWIVEPSSSPLKKVSNDVNFLAVTPMQAQNCLNDSPEKLAKTSHVIIGGGAVNNSFTEKIQSFKNEFYSTYGMTETLSHIALKRLNGPKKSDSFETLPAYTVTINNSNCLVIKCPTLFPEPIETNDIVKLTKSGFEWLGRKDNVVNSGGIKLFPEAIEEKLMKILPETLFYLTSKKDTHLGEKLVLVCEEKLEIDWEKVNLAKYEIPKETIIQKIVLTETGKIKRMKF